MQDLARRIRFAVNFILARGYTLKANPNLETKETLAILEMQYEEVLEDTRKGYRMRGAPF